MKTGNKDYLDWYISTADKLVSVIWAYRNLHGDVIIDKNNEEVWLW